ncbi:MAG: DUF3306 domain-containing protein [Pseudomonadota bacterium]
MSDDERRSDGEGFFASWSRRKRAATRAEAIEGRTKEAATDTQGEPTAAADEPPSPEVEREITPEELEALPSIDEITGSTDLQPFMKRGVPQALQRAAMRKVWLTNSLISQHDDPAVDYAWDWNTPGAVPGAGGVLQEDKVAKMVGDLMNREIRSAQESSDESDTSLPARADTHEDAEAATDLAQASCEGGAAAGERPEAPHVPACDEDRAERTSVQAPIVSKAATDLSSPEPRDSVATQRPLRRHGGALPT